MLKRLDAREVSGFGVNKFARRDPDFADKRAVGDAEDGGTLGETFELDDVHEALALHAPEALLILAFNK